MLFIEEDTIKSHEIDFLKRYVVLQDLFEDLVTSKISTNNANIDQITIIADLMQRYDKNDLADEEIIIIK